MVCTRFHLSRIHDFVFSNLSLVAEDTTTQRKLATGFSSDLGYDNGKVPNLGLYSQTQPINYYLECYIFTAVTDKQKPDDYWHRAGIMVGARYWFRTSDPCRVKAVLYR